MRILGTPLGWIMHACYLLVNNYGIALIMFTILTRLVLLPLAIKQQKGMVKMAMFKPKMDEIQKKYEKNPNKLNEELSALYQREGYNPLSGCLPTLVQFPILFGLIDVIYNPLRHLLKMSDPIIAQAIEIAKTVLGDAGMSRYSQEMSVISAVSQKPDAFAAMGDFVTQVQNFDFTFFGLDMGVTPTFALNIFLLIPIISGITSYMMSQVSLKMGSMPDEGSAATMNKSMMLMMPLMSVWIAFQVPAGVGIYWVLSNIFMIIQQYALYKFYNPKEMAEKVKAEMEVEKERERQEKIEARKLLREKQSEKDKEIEADKASGKKKPKKSAPAPVIEEDEEIDEAALTQKEINRMKLAAARKRDAEKYGEEYVEVTDEDLK